MRNLPAGFLLLALACAHPLPQPRPFRDDFAGETRKGPLMIVIDAGRTTLGARPGEPGYVPAQRLHEVELTPFAIGAAEVTNAEFCEFLNEQKNRPILGRPLVLLDDKSGIVENSGVFQPRPGFGKRPVTRVTWRGARAYCRWLSSKTKQQYDLPSAAQWEASARAGTRTTWWWGDADDPARHRTRSDSSADTGSYPPNPWGLYDTTGNVWEWVLDCYERDFALFAPARDPVLIDDECMTPEIRGGGYADDSAFARPAFRANYWWAPGVDSIGFRVQRQWSRSEP